MRPLMVAISILAIAGCGGQPIVGVVPQYSVTPDRVECPNATRQMEFTDPGSGKPYYACQWFCAYWDGSDRTAVSITFPKTTAGYEPPCLECIYTEPAKPEQCPP